MHIATLLERLSLKYYKVRSWFFPYNVIKVYNIPRTWTDRSEVLFHAVFTVLVDFVETEGKFAPREWLRTASDSDRFTDYRIMLDEVEKRYGPLAPEEDELRQYNAECFEAYTEILHMYAWYKEGRWKIPEEAYYDLDLEQCHTFICDKMLSRAVALRHNYWS